MKAKPNNLDEIKKMDERIRQEGKPKVALGTLLSKIGKSKPKAKKPKSNAKDSS